MAANKLLFGVLALLFCSVVFADPFTPRIVQHSTPRLMRSYRGSSLFAIAAPGYAKPLLLVSLNATTRYDAGYDYGRLLANESLSTWNSLINSLGLNKVEEEVIFDFLDYEWTKFLSKQLPADYAAELRGIDDGAHAAGIPGLGRLITRATVFANFPGDIGSNIEWLLIDQLHNNTITEERAETIRAIARNISSRWSRTRMHCSMAGVWGPRTQDGKLYTMRNLDWAADTGIADNKLVTVFHPPGRIPHATFGFAGLFGSLAGLSAAGLTVHEAGQDSRDETFDGFPWITRLRYIMENAHNLAEARALWMATNNTLGMNHGIGSAADTQFLALETRAHYTAYFGANDPREAAYVYEGQHMGAPLPNALWRTNHAYDPDIISHNVDSHPGGDTLTRYFLLHDTIDGYGTSATSIGPLQAVNITAVVGDKGGSSRESFLSCAAASKGENILSVTFDPAARTVYVAFEEGRAAAHVPACCGAYVQLDLTPWF
eukprot:m.228380 g.228380  ORF g.228380 m.228380 type:complete len:489 (-) comp17465_c0_seq1:28-1494(-)